MKVFRPSPPPSADSSPDDLRKWADQIAKCSISIGKTIEARKIRSNEFPLVIGAVVKGFCDYTGLKMGSVLEMIRRAAVANELPETSPADVSGPFPLTSPLEIRLADLLFGKNYRAESLETIRALAAAEIQTKAILS